MREKTLFEEMQDAHDAFVRLFYAVFPWFLPFREWLFKKILLIMNTIRRSR